MHIIDLKLPESFREREREREKYEKQDQTICFFMSLSRSLPDFSARRKIEL